MPRLVCVWCGCFWTVLRAPVSCASAVLGRPATAFPSPQGQSRGPLCRAGRAGQAGEGNQEGPAGFSLLTAQGMLWGGLATCWLCWEGPALLGMCSYGHRAPHLFGNINWPLSRFRSKTSLAETEPFSLRGGKHLDREEWGRWPQRGFWVTLWRTHKGELFLESDLALWVFAGPAQRWGDMEGTLAGDPREEAPSLKGCSARSLRRADLAFPQY